MGRELTVALVGATGVVGAEFLKCMEERNFPVKELRLLATKRSEGRELSFRGETHIVHETTHDAFDGADVAFISAEKLPLDVKVRGYYEVVPDLVVEIVSPNDSPEYIAQRVAMWRSFGVPLVWAVYPVTRTVAVHPLNGTALLYTDNDILDGGAVLPDFQCVVRDIFDW